MQVRRLHWEMNYSGFRVTVVRPPKTVELAEGHSTKLRDMNNVSCLSAGSTLNEQGRSTCRVTIGSAYQSDFPAKSVGFTDMAEGGRSAVSAPNVVLGRLPICNSSIPPLIMSA